MLFMYKDWITPKWFSFIDFLLLIKKITRITRINIHDFFPTNIDVNKN